MTENDNILDELIAERKRIDNLIEKYKKENNLTVNNTQLNKKDVSFEELLEDSIQCGKYYAKEQSDNIKSDKGIYVKNYNCSRTYNVNPTYNINIDNSVHNNTHNESHVNNTLGVGDKAIESVGKLIGNILENF